MYQILKKQLTLSENSTLALGKILSSTSVTLNPPICLALVTRGCRSRAAQVPSVPCAQQAAHTWELVLAPSNSISYHLLTIQANKTPLGPS